ncbi:MAG: hybrid sensor histidine kinase/response regulator [Candidatus Kapabacteria bacterium]|nr:hybrid sensor histidine kinase/response regulator [Candidatus Kapabacteria bacterium]
MNILIIDDSFTQRFGLRQLLVSDGFKDVVMAESAIEGLKILGINENLEFVENHQNNIDLILMDIKMPKITGIKATQIIKSFPSLYDIPIIIISSSEDLKDLSAAFTAGAIDYIVKPPNEIDLNLRVRSALSLKNEIDKRKARELELVTLNKTLANVLEELADNNIQLEQANTTKDKFFSIISHDLKNPVLAINLGLESLIKYFENFETEEIKDNLNKIHLTSKNISSLLENLLQWARTQTGKINFEPDIFDLNELVLDNLSIMKEYADKKQIQIITDINKYSMVYCDYNMISTVLRNLITNSIKFTKEKGEIIISTLLNPLRKVYEISVQDNGLGIDSETLDNLFKIGTSRSTSGTNNEAGTGLGLILCREFVEINKGNIWVESKLGKGSTFNFTIPARL